MCILLLWVLLRREPNLVALRSAYFKLKIQKIHALRSWPRSLMFALHQSLAIPSPAVILRTMYLLMTLKSKSLADIFFFYFQIYSVTQLTSSPECPQGHSNSARSKPNYFPFQQNLFLLFCSYFSEWIIILFVVKREIWVSLSTLNLTL